MNKTNNIYFIGIGGIGMSAIARYFKFKGYEVSGYDRTPSDLTHALESEGIAVHYEDNIKYVPKDVENALVIYTPAIPAEMGELTYVREKGYKVVKRSKALGEIARGQSCLAISGTHGKTTTSTLLSHIFTSEGTGCSAFLGGISKNYGTNLLMSHTPVIVAEADEFDRSFLQLYPEIAVITAMDADHLDIYSDIEHVHEAFRAFAGQTSGSLIIKQGLPISAEHTKAKIYTYSFNSETSDFHAKNLRLDECGYYTFDLVHPWGVVKDCRCGVPGWVNVENAVAASAVALAYGLKPEGIREALASFSGVRRRFDIHFNAPGCTYIDDYAHHPKEIEAAIGSIREMFPGRKLTAVFQPHLYTRTRDFAGEFAQALSKVDRLILLDIYPAREEPIPGVSSSLIFDEVTIGDKTMIEKLQLMDLLAGEDIDVLISLGAGDIDRFIGPITQMISSRYDK